MKVQVSVVTVNGKSKLLVNLLAENEGEKQFFEEAFEACEDYDLSFQLKEAPDGELGSPLSRGVVDE